MKQANEKPAQPASLDALVTKEGSERIYKAVDLISQGEQLYGKNPIAGLAAMYLGMRMLPQNSVPELDKHLKAYEAIFSQAIGAQMGSYGAKTQTKPGYEGNTPKRAATAPYKG